MPHFYTISTEELRTATGQSHWACEGVECWIYAQEHRDVIPELVPLLRIYKPSEDDYLYTCDANEVASALANPMPWDRWEYNGMAGFVLPTSVPANKYAGLTVPLHRLWHSEADEHFFCTSDEEVNRAIGLGFSQEPDACRVLKYPPPGPFPEPSAMFRLWHDSRTWYDTAWEAVKDIAETALAVYGFYQLITGGSGKTKDDPSTGTVKSSLTGENSKYSQADWRWCLKCQSLFFAGNPGSVCPCGGAHDPSGSGNYQLTVNPPFNAGEADWRWCNRCQGLAWDGPGTTGICPAGGTHDYSGSGNYCLVYNAPTLGQPGWAWCRNCQALFFADNPGSACPCGGPHDASGQVPNNYSLAIV